MRHDDSDSTARPATAGSNPSSRARRGGSRALVGARRPRRSTHHRDECASKSTVCANGNTVSIFAPGQQVIPPDGQSVTLNGDFSNFPGLGVQVNNWYWTAVSLPVQKGDPQNPDNSGAQFAISDQCVLHISPPGMGKGSRRT